MKTSLVTKKLQNRLSKQQRTAGKFIWGIHDNEPGIIYVDPRLSSRQRLDASIHEWLHDKFEFGAHDERTVTGLASDLAAMLTKDGWVRRNK